MKSFRDILNGRMRTGKGRLVLESTKSYQIRVKIFITHKLTSKTLFLVYLQSRVKTTWRFSSPARKFIFKSLQLRGAVTFYCLDFIVCERLLLLYWIETRAVCGIRLETKMFFQLR
jgi:hypothetical protein